MALDSSGDAWVMNTSGLSGYFPQGAHLNASPCTGGGLTGPGSVIVDGLNFIWVANNNGTISKLDHTGSALSGSAGYSGAGTSATGGIAVDNSGSVWISNTSSNTLTEFLGAAAPLAPLSTGSQSSTTGTRP